MTTMIAAGFVMSSDLQISSRYVMMQGEEYLCFGIGETRIGFDIASPRSYSKPGLKLTHVSVSNFSKSVQLERRNLDEDMPDVLLGRDILTCGTVLVDQSERQITFEKAIQSTRLGSSLEVKMTSSLSTTAIVDGKTFPAGKILRLARVKGVGQEQIGRFTMFGKGREFLKRAQYGSNAEFGLGLVPGSRLRFSLANNRLEYEGSYESGVALALCELVPGGWWYKHEAGQWYCSGGYTLSADGTIKNFWDYFVGLDTMNIKRMMDLVQVSPLNFAKNAIHAKSLSYVDKKGVEQKIQLDE